MILTTQFSTKDADPEDLDLMIGTFGTVVTSFISNVDNVMTITVEGSSLAIMEWLSDEYDGKAEMALDEMIKAARDGRLWD